MAHPGSSGAMRLLTEGDREAASAEFRLDVGESVAGELIYERPAR